MTVRFSIIIPTLNEAAHIEACLTALQAWRDRCELIVVDGGSLDNTVDLARPLADEVKVSTPGRAVQMNQGAGAARGDILIFLHADTSLPDQALDLIESTPQPWGRFDIQLQGEHPMLFLVAKLMNFRSCLTGIATGDQVIFVERKLFFNAGAYPDIALMEDIALSKQLKQYARPACIHNKVISSGRRWETFGLWRTIVLMWRLRLGYFLGENPAYLAKLYQRGRLWNL